MTFYETPAFFIVLAIAAVPALILGCAQKKLKYYGFAASVVFLLMLFSRDLAGMACFVGYVVLACALTHVIQRAFQKQASYALPLYYVSLVLAIAPVVIFKISAVFDANLLGFLGLSYITFKVVQVLIELRDGLIKELTLFEYLYFLIFFAPFTSGPIMRSRDFSADIAQVPERSEYLRMFTRGILLIVGGAVYKYVFSALLSWAMWFLPTYVASDAVGLSDALIGPLAQFIEAYSYGFYLFFDFAGYSLMAIGVGLLFGINVPQNFRAPFLALDIKDFWNRWHISLSWWLRDYVFMRFSRVCLKRKIFGSRLTIAMSGFMVNMVIMGLWHGVTLDYFVYGLYHGALLALTELFQKKSKFYKKHRKSRWFKVVSWIVTINLVMFGLALFSGQIGGLFAGWIA